MNREIALTPPASPAGDTTEGGGAGLAESIAHTAHEATDRLKSTATHAREKIEQAASEKKGHAAERVDAYGAAVHESARSLEADDPNIAWLTHRAADRLNQVAGYMRTRDFHGLRHDVENLARQHPAAFFGGLFVAGLVLGNVVKASARSRRTDSGNSLASSTLSPEELSSGYVPEPAPREG